LIHEVRLRIRWRDLDAYGHVNNAVYLNYLEECRDRMVEDLFGEHVAWDFVLAHVRIDFRSQLTQDDGEVLVRCAVASVGRSSLRTREEVLKTDGTLAAEASSVIVPRASDGNGSRPLTQAERAVLLAEIESGATPSDRVR
jgi:acyl-CoA thioester hydrolase